MTRHYRVVSGGATPDEAWFEDAAAAAAAIASRLGVAADDLDRHRARVTVDPLVVRRDDARWRSAAIWNYRSDAGSVRLFEMIKVDEAQYDH